MVDFVIYELLDQHKELDASLLEPYENLLVCFTLFIYSQLFCTVLEYFALFLYGTFSCKVVLLSTCVK